MLNNKLNEITKNFLTENLYKKPPLQSYIETIMRISETLKPSSIKEKRILEVLKYTIREVKNGTKKLLEENQMLSERIKVLEEQNKK